MALGTYEKNEKGLNGYSIGDMVHAVNMTCYSLGHSLLERELEGYSDPNYGSFTVTYIRKNGKFVYRITDNVTLSEIQSERKQTLYDCQTSAGKMILGIIDRLVTMNCAVPLLYKP